MKKKINKKGLLTRIGIIISSTALCFGAVLGIEYFNSKKELNESVIIGEIIDNGIRLKQNKIADGDTLSISAIVNPDYAYDKTLEWSVEWATSSTSNVNDYITLTPSSDTLTCTVAVKKAFTTQIRLICRSKANSMVFAECTIDYVGRTLEYIPASLPLDYDFTGENLSDYTISELVFDVLGFSFDSSKYTTTGGTLSGVVKDLEFNSFEMNNNVISTTDMNLSLQQYLVATYDDLGNAYNSTNGALNIELYVAGNLYYNDTLLAPTTSLSLATTVYFDLTAYTVTSITLDDTQIIF